MNRFNQEPRYLSYTWNGSSWVFSYSLPPFNTSEGGWVLRSFVVILLGLVTIALLSLSTVFGAPPAAPEPREAPPKFGLPKFKDHFDVVVFANQRPVRVRVLALQEGKPVGEIWRTRLQKVFDFCDRDTDGHIGEKEVKFVFADQGMAQLLANGFYQPVGNTVPTLATLDQDSDGKVSFDEFTAYYKLSATQVIRVQALQPDNSQNAAVTEGLFKLLDANSDGKLTKDEVNAAEKLLATKDTDEDECLSMRELATYLYSDNRPLRAIKNNAAPYPPPRGSEMVVIFEADRVPGTVTQYLIKKYDKDDDLNLTVAESGFDNFSFKSLDKNNNGKLNAEELDAWRTGVPDLDITLSFAPKMADCRAKVNDEKAAAARGLKVKQAEAGRLVLHVGRQPIDFAAFPTVAQYGAQVSLKQQYGYLFTQAAGAKGHIVEKDLSGPNAVQFQFVRVMFDAADRDADGKMTKAEFDGYFDLQDSFRNISLSITPAIQTPTLFQLLDDTRDGRLSVRELRTAWNRLIVLEQNTGDVITRDIIQPSVSLRLSRTLDRYYASQPVSYDSYGNQAPVPTKGPLWFRKMDRNADGDLSRSEYLGSKEEFNTIDADRDSLISLEEAEAFDKKTRAKDK